MKLNLTTTVLRSKLQIEGYDLVRSDQTRRGGSVACFVKNSISYKRKPIIRVKANSKPWFDNQIVSAIQRRDKLYKKFKHSGLETDKDNFKVTKMHLEKMILKKKKSYFEELGKNRNKPKELWKTLKSLGLSSDKTRQSKISLKKDGAIQYEALENPNTFKRFYSELAGGLQEKLPRAPNRFTIQTKTTTPRLYATYPMTLNFQTYLKMFKRFYLASIPVKPLEWTKYQQNF